MKFNYNGCIVEIKVTPENGKKVNQFITDELYNKIYIALIDAANFRSGQGQYGLAEIYSRIALSMIDNKI